MVEDSVGHGQGDSEDEIVCLDDSDEDIRVVCAARDGNFDRCKKLIEMGADVNGRDFGGGTALMWAVKDNKPVRCDGSLR